MTVLMIVLFMTGLSFVGGCLIGYEIGRIDGEEAGYMEFINETRSGDGDCEEDVQ